MREYFYLNYTLRITVMVIIILHVLLLLLLGFLSYFSLLKLVSVHWGNHNRLLSLAKK